MQNRAKSVCLFNRLCIKPKLSIYKGDIMANNNDNNEKSKFNLMAELKSWLGIIVTAAIIAFCLNNFIIANSHVPSARSSHSVQKTL